MKPRNRGNNGRRDIIFIKTKLSLSLLFCLVCLKLISNKCGQQSYLNHLFQAPLQFLQRQTNFLTINIHHILFITQLLTPLQILKTATIAMDKEADLGRDLDMDSLRISLPQK